MLQFQLVPCHESLRHQALISPGRKIIGIGAGEKLWKWWVWCLHRILSRHVSPSFKSYQFPKQFTRYLRWSCTTFWGKVCWSPNYEKQGNLLPRNKPSLRHTKQGGNQLKKIIFPTFMYVKNSPLYLATGFSDTAINR
jgi:hypothetical protein